MIDWLFPQVRKNVLALLLMAPERRWHLRDVVRRTGGAVGTVRRELKGLAECGILLETRDGNRTYYQANRRCPAFPELSSLIRKTAGLADRLAEALSPLSDRIDVAFVYGSQANGQAGPESDIDVMVIGKAGFAEVVSAMGEAQELIGREVNPTVYSRVEFRSKLASEHHFVTAVMKAPKVFLIGGEDELDRLGD